MGQMIVSIRLSGNFRVDESFAFFIRELWHYAFFVSKIFYFSDNVVEKITTSRLETMYFYRG